MADPEQARATQLRNIEAKTGQDLDSLCASILASGKAKHGEVRSWLMESCGLGYGDANGLAHHYATRGNAASPNDDVFATIYTGKKQHLRAIHDAVISAITPWGDFEVAPKKGYVALRRKKQFAMLGPKTADRAELGINLKDQIDSARIVPQKPGGMCQYSVSLSTPSDLDGEVLAALRRAYEAAA